MVKLLAPAGIGVYLIARKQRALGTRLGRPAAGLHALLSRYRACRIDLHHHAGTTSRPITLDHFVASAPAFLDPDALRPAWDHDELAWIVTQAARQMKHGELHRREVLDRVGRVAGLYLLYARQGGVAAACSSSPSPAVKRWSSATCSPTPGSSAPSSSKAPAPAASSKA